jgi:hypothetical protein
MRRPRASRVTAAKVEVGIKAEQGKRETVLAPRFSVAGSGVTALCGQDRLDIELEADRKVGLGLLDK